MLEHFCKCLIFQSVWDLLNGLHVNSVYAKTSNNFALCTWPFVNATAAAYNTLQNGKSALDAVEDGCNYCELAQCNYSVGYGGHPDENGETTLDAMIMNGNDQTMGAVGCLYNIKKAISVARSVMDNSKHSFLVGHEEYPPAPFISHKDLLPPPNSLPNKGIATKYGIAMGYKEESLQTEYSLKQFQAWKNGNCQPNFRRNVIPDPNTSCGPYRRSVEPKADVIKGDIVRDTIGVIARDSNGMMAVGLSTNGANHKIPGLLIYVASRVGDSPIPGAGGYADSSIGAAVATGDGDFMMRHLPSYQAVENMRNGMTPGEAAKNSVHRIISKVSDFYGAVVAANSNGAHGAACHGWKDFTYTYQGTENPKPIEITIQCM